MSIPFRENIIIMFHIVKDTNWFVNTVDLLKRFYNIIPITEVDAFYNQNASCKSSCVLSFDDGHESFYSTIFPVLKQLKIPAVLYVSPKRILNRKNFWHQELIDCDKNKMKEVIAEYLSIDKYLISDFDTRFILKCLKIKHIEKIISIYTSKNKEGKKKCFLVTPEQLIEMHSSGLVTIGAHTQNHPILANEDDQSSEYEIRYSIKELSSLLNSEVKYFSYPNGKKNMDYSQREINTLNKNGISITVCTEIGEFSRSDNQQEIPRIGLTYGSNLHILGKIILGKHWAKFVSKDDEYNQRLKIYTILRDNNKL